MHFINRAKFPEAPIDKLQEFIVKKKASWATYNSARINKTKPLPSRPPSLWLHDDIRNPLKKLFLMNCGYCGIHTNTGRDAEVDHFHPTSKDKNADFVFEWTNYVWSCHSCNGLKSNTYPFLNPTSEEEIKHIYFHPADGRYLIYKKSPDNIKNKYNLTVENSNINSSNRPARRKYTYIDTNRHLIEIRLCHLMYITERSISGNDSEASILKYEELEGKKNSFLGVIRSGDYLFLIKEIIDAFNKEHESFPYTFNELLLESNYLDELL